MAKNDKLMVAGLEDRQWRKTKTWQPCLSKIELPISKKHNYHLNNCIIVGGGRCTANITSNSQLEWTQIKNKQTMK